MVIREHVPQRLDLFSKKEDRDVGPECEECCSKCLSITDPTTKPVDVIQWIYVRVQEVEHGEKGVLVVEERRR
jgi:hypothetical protein